MQMVRKRSRSILTLLALALIAAALTGAFWPRAVMVDLGEVTRGPMMLTIDEEGRTQVSEPYVVSTPVAGRLQRVQVHPGDPVVRGETVVAHMLPADPAALDVRTREQARAAVTAAEAALRVAQADRNAAIARRDLAQTELERTRRLAESEIASSAALDRALQAYRVAQASVQTAEAAIAMREAELQNAQAQLIGFDDPRLGAAARGAEEDHIPLYAPADGRILRIMQESETTLPAGTPIMEIGDIAGSLEVEVELLSSDAVQVEPGDPVLLVDWGGLEELRGEVTRIDPFALTRISALGVEEQRVPVTIAITSPAEARSALGHGYRVKVRIIVWQDADAVLVPASALFRAGGDWAVFVETGGRAALRLVEVGHNNGVSAEVRAGLEPGEPVVLYPSAAVSDGARISQRKLE